MTSPQKPKSPYKSAIPSKYDPRQSDEQLDQLISQSKSHISRNLLLETNDYDYFQNTPVQVDPSRPLTSAGRKVVSKGTFDCNFISTILLLISYHFLFFFFLKNHKEFVVVLKEKIIFLRSLLSKKSLLFLD